MKAIFVILTGKLNRGDRCVIQHEGYQGHEEDVVHLTMRGFNRESLVSFVHLVFHFAAAGRRSGVTTSRCTDLVERIALDWEVTSTLCVIGVEIGGRGARRGSGFDVGPKAIETKRQPGRAKRPLPAITQCYPRSGISRCPASQVGAADGGGEADGSGGSGGDWG